MTLPAQTMTARELEDRLAQELRAAGRDNSSMAAMYYGCLNGDLHPWRVSTGERFIVRRSLTESEQAALAMGLDRRLNAMPGKRHEVVSEDYLARESFDFVFDRGHAEAFIARMKQEWAAPTAAPEPGAGPVVAEAPARRPSPSEMLAMHEREPGKWTGRALGEMYWPNQKHPGNEKTAFKYMAKARPKPSKV